MKTLVPVQRKASQLLASGFILLVALVTLSVWFAERRSASSALAEAGLDAVRQLSKVLSTLQDAETGQRGFLLTGDPAYLEPYEAASRDFGPDLERLYSLLGPQAQADVGVLRSLAANKMRELAETIALRRGGDPAAAMAIVQNGSGKALMDQARGVIERIQADEMRSAAGRRSESRRDGETLQAGTVLAALLTVLLAVYAIRSTRQQTRQMLATQSGLRALNKDLEGIVAEQLLAAQAGLWALNEDLEATVAERTRSLRESEAEFRVLAEVMPGLVFIADGSGVTTYANPQFGRYTGLGAGQLMGLGWVQALHPDDCESTSDAWSACVSSGDPFEREYRLRRHDGAYRWFLGRAVPVRDGARVAIRWIGACTDIDAHKRAETGLAEANAELEARVVKRSRELDRIFKLSMDLLAVNDFEGRFRNVSPAWERITGHATEGALTRTFRDFVHPDDLAATEAAHARLLQGEATVGFENRFRRQDGSYCRLSWRAVPMIEEGLIYSVARDVTQERERDEQLRQSQKMEVVGQLTGGIAHDFNNLLTVILGSMELLGRDLRDAEPKLRRRIDIAMEGATRAAALTHRLLAFSRRQPLEPKPVQPDRLITGMSDLLHRVLGEAVALEIVNAAGLWRVLADANQLENALLNLAVNARDAMPGGGRLTIETGNVHLDDGYAAAQAEVSPGHYATIAVADTGQGVTPEVRARMFEPFFTTKAPGAGTGLGLAQVYGFIKQSGGHVTIHSEPGHGTTVRLYLPRFRGADIAAPAAEPPSGDIQARGETILVVEDEAGVLAFAVEVLEALGYHVLAAEDAVMALTLLQREPGVALLFTDVVLAGAMNGRQLADEALRRRPGLRLLFTTGYTRNAIIHHGRLDDGISLLSKPYTFSSLGAKVRGVLDGG